MVPNLKHGGIREDARGLSPQHLSLKMFQYQSYWGGEGVGKFGNQLEQRTKKNNLMSF